ncbi:DMT family transporter [Massilia niastensis]|uniref:DMT family transporter n=1 Tax=Massilia niastensis TaxID=544911 RepID=UPI00037B467C|nr:DMT family transporter [Massilia niastensis]
MTVRIVGELLALVSACCFAAANITVARGATGKEQDNGAFLSILITALMAGGVWIAAGQRGGPQPGPASLLWFAAAGVLTMFIGRVFLFASVQHLGAVRASAVKRLNPVFSILLGVLVLGESIDSFTAIGMVLIFSSFAVLVRHSLQAAGAARAAREAPPASWQDRLKSLGFFYGPVSALAYAVGYVARKQGLTLTPDAAFGTMVGALVGALVFVIAARFVDSYRTSLRAAFTCFNPWLLAAGVLSSAGQLLYFAALSHTTISRVALVSSMEVFVTIFLSVIILRKTEQLNAATLQAAGLGVAGTVLIVLH